MTRNVLIIGGGRVGRHVAEDLNDIQNNITVIELDAEKCEQISSKVKNVIQGDGTDPDVFDEANPTDADVVAALTNATRVNLEICEMAHEIAPDARTILRISRDGEQDYGHRRFVDDIVYPAAAGARVAVERINNV